MGPRRNLAELPRLAIYAIEKEGSKVSLRTRSARNGTTKTSADSRRCF
jgi:hypothetical protein